jgi:hypothetical protein
MRTGSLKDLLEASGARWGFESRVPGARYHSSKRASYPSRALRLELLESCPDGMGAGPAIESPPLSARRSVIDTSTHSNRAS